MRRVPRAQEEQLEGSQRRRRQDEEWAQEQAVWNWGRLVRAAQDRKTYGVHHRQDSDSFVPASLLGKDSKIESIMSVATELNDENPAISLILFEHAYKLSQELDPKSEGRGVLQFKTGLMSVIRKKSINKDGGMTIQGRDHKQIGEFYKIYREQLQSMEHEYQQEQLTKSGWSKDPEAMERGVLLKKGYKVLKVLGDVLKALPRESGYDDTEVKQIMKIDAVKIEEFGAYNILPLDAVGISHLILLKPEVKAAMAAVKYTDMSPVTEDFHLKYQRHIDIFDVLEYIFHFQKDNTKNQREHLVLLLANAQSRERNSDQSSQLEQGALDIVLKKVLSNYESWCQYLQETFKHKHATNKEKLILIALYLLIWGEAGNVRFLPEGRCYIFHQMATEVLSIVRNNVPVHETRNYKNGDGSFLSEIIEPLYNSIAKEVSKCDHGKKPHSAWRNYDDFNEFFWSRSCFELSWPMNMEAAFFAKETKNETGVKGKKDNSSMGKTNFVEHRSFLHLYHSFHRLWIFFVLMFQGLIIIAFSNGWKWTTVERLLSIGPTYAAMNFIQSVLDVMFMYGAYRRSKHSAVSRIFIHLLWFGGLSAFLIYLYIQILQEGDAVHSPFFHLFVLVLGVYIGLLFLSYLLMLIPAYRALSKKFDNWKVLRFFKWIGQEQFYVGRNLYENIQDYLKYILFWIVVLSCKFTFSYFLMIKPLVPATRIIVSFTNINYTWHDIVSKNNGNALTVAALWSPIAMIYFLDVSVWYTVISALVGGFIGAKQRLGEIRSLEMLRKRFQMFPSAFVKLLPTRMQSEDSENPESSENSENYGKQAEELEAQKNAAARFAPYWNQIIECLREEDYISNLEKDLLCMPPNNINLPIVQFPLFLLTTKIEAMELLAAKQFRDLDLRDKMQKDEYMFLAFKEVYYTLDRLFNDILASDECKIWVTDLIKDVKDAIEQGTLYLSFRMSKIKIVRQKFSALLSDFNYCETETRLSKAKEAMKSLYDTVINEFCTPHLRERNEERIRRSRTPRNMERFSELKWPSDIKREQIERLYKLMNKQESAANIPQNLEARRRLQFFCNSLFMEMPKAPLTKKMVSFSVFTPFFEEDVFYDNKSLLKYNDDNISTLFYLQKIFPDEWDYLLERIGKEKVKEEFEEELTPGSDVPLEVLLWASYRGQTLARTVRGMMYYRRAIVLQSMLEQTDLGDTKENQEVVTKKESEALAHAEAQADLKFTYVVTCQKYGAQKRAKDIRAEHILNLMKENNGLRIAFVDSVDTIQDTKEYYSKVVKADETGNDQEIYSIKLPGNPILGEGKPENQNHAIIFTRGEAIQTIDMNQDNYFEETLKMRNLLEEFNSKEHGCHDPRILGVREHVFTGSVSSLGWFMSTQETSFVTLGQRVLASPLKIRMHYGHPDVFDRVFHVTRGGISKSSKVINISEDIFAGFNSTLRQGNVTHHEYIQVGKGRDVGLNQIAMFEGKVAGGNGEQSLSRDVYRLGQLLDFFRMLSFYITSVGYYLCTMMTSLTVYVFLYGKAYLALSGVEKALQTSADVTNNKALNAALNTQLLIQIGVFTAVPMIVGFILEEGVLKAIISFATMQLQLASVFFTFSLGTRTHYFGRSILHGGAKYKATGRGFVVSHTKFADNYRAFSRSHCVKAFEIVMLLLVYHAYGSNKGTGLGYILLNISSWFLAISWLFAPFIFNPSGFEWHKTVNDFDDWTNWILYKGSVGVNPDNSWESWWEDEQIHIRFFRGKILETILSLRFFWFQYGVVYQLDAAGGNNNSWVYGVSWLVLIGIVLMFKVYTLSSKKSFRILRNYSRILQCFLVISIIAAMVSVIRWTSMTVTDVFASALALIPTGWGILSIAITWKSVVKKLGLWKSIRSIARLYDAAMGVAIFLPIACLSWFPFVSTFQTRLLFNQAFSRGLEISPILAGNKQTIKKPNEKKEKKKEKK